MNCPVFFSGQEANMDGGYHSVKTKYTKLIDIMVNTSDFQTHCVRTEIFLTERQTHEPVHQHHLTFKLNSHDNLKRLEADDVQLLKNGSL